MAFVISVPIPVPIPMPRFQYRGLQMALILVSAFTLLLRHESRLGLYEIIGQNIFEDLRLRF